jgi:hypothetical protein
MLMSAMVAMAEAAPTNPYTIALIALAATLLGAAITALGQILGHRHQSRLAAEHALRDARRQVYADFLTAIDGVWNASTQRDFMQSEDDGRPTRREVERAYLDLYVAETPLVLLAGDQVRELARGVLLYHRSLAVAAMADEPLPPDAPEDSDRAALRVAMQHELGIATRRRDTSAVSARPPQAP